MPSRLSLDTLSISLLGQLAYEANDGPFWCAVEGDGGEVRMKIIKADNAPAVLPTAGQKIYALDTLRALNKHADFDGAWVVMWCDPALRPDPDAILGYRLEFERLGMMHKDRDSDRNVFVDNTMSMAELLSSPVSDRVQAAWSAFTNYRKLTKDVGVRPDQTRKAAQGEASVDPRVKVVPFVG